MSSAGHVLDMIARVKNNRALKEQNLSKYRKIKAAYEKQSDHHISFRDKNKLPEQESKNLRNSIRERLKQEQKKQLTKTISLIIILALAISAGFYIFLTII